MPTKVAPSSSAPSVAPGRIELFPSGVLNRLAGGEPGPPKQEAPGNGAAESARVAKQRIDGWFADGAARQRVQSGDVDPVWRTIESSALDHFDPPPSLVRVGRDSMTRGEKVVNQTVSVLRQMWASPNQVDAAPPGTRDPLPEDRQGGGPSDQMYRNGLGYAQGEAIRKAWSKPTSWRRTEVELVVSATGDVEKVRVVSSSLIPKLDQLAVTAVEKAARSRAATRDDGQRTITRWAVECTYAADAINQLSFHFDETGELRKHDRARGKNHDDDEYHVPGGGRVERKVTLLSIQFQPSR